MSHWDSVKAFIKYYRPALLLMALIGLATIVSCVHLGY